MPAFAGAALSAYAAVNSVSRSKRRRKMKEEVTQVTQFGALCKVSLEDATTVAAVETLIRRLVPHTCTYALTVVQGVTPGAVYANSDVSVVITTSLCGFYAVIGELADAATVVADAAALLTTDTKWSFLYAHPEAAWEHLLVERLGAPRFERSCFASLHSSPVLEELKPLPLGYLVKPLSPKLLARYQKVHEWHLSTWPDPAVFFKKGGVGFVVLSKNNRVVAGCITAFIGDKVHELDIFTVPSSQKKGLALAVAMHTVCALMDQVTETNNRDSAPGNRPSVSWSCDAQNVPSRKVGERLGFRFTHNVGCFQSPEME